MSRTEHGDLVAEQTAHFAFASDFMFRSDKLQARGEQQKAVKAKGRALAHFDAFRQVNWGGVVPDISEVLNGATDLRIELLEKNLQIPPKLN